MASYGQRRRRNTTTISTGGAVNKLAQRIGQRQSGVARTQGAEYKPAVGGGRNAQYAGGAPIADLLRNQQTGGSAYQGAALQSKVAERRKLFQAGGGGKDWRQKIYGSDFKAGELGKLKGQIAFGDAAAAQGAALPGNLTAEKLAAARARYAELIAKRKKALGQA